MTIELDSKEVYYLIDLLNESHRTDDTAMAIQTQLITATLLNYAG